MTVLVHDRYVSLDGAVALLNDEELASVREIVQQAVIRYDAEHPHTEPDSHGG